MARRQIAGIIHEVFTGLIERKSPIARIEPREPGARLEIFDPQLAQQVAIGDSVAISGCCLTVVGIDAERVAFEAGPETLRRTTLGSRAAGEHVNLERSLRLGDALGGHLVTGHVDGVGTLVARVDDQDWSTFEFELPAELAPQLASKGSIAVDGVSLTLVDVSDQRFSVALIPHTLAVTTLGALRVGQQVNLESDVLAKYVARQVAAYLGHSRQ